jgi:transposase-like protein
MDTHKNAPLTPKGRETMVRAVVDEGLSKAAAARRFNTTPKTVGKWIERFEAEGAEGLRDRSSRPHSSPSQAAPAVCAAVEALRRQRCTGKQIALEAGLRDYGDTDYADYGDTTAFTEFRGISWDSRRAMARASAARFAAAKRRQARDPARQVKTGVSP